MNNFLEIAAIILIIVIQIIIALRAYNQITHMKSFLPEGRYSLSLKEYEIPSEKILDLEPRQVINRITYLAKRNEDSSNNKNMESEMEELLETISHYDEEGA